MFIELKLFWIQVNVSMFERLILAPKNQRVPSSVLSLNRRMRKNVCDFVRQFYSDETEIRDDKICETRKIGQNGKGKLAGKLEHCIGQVVQIKIYHRLAIKFSEIFLNTTWTVPLNYLAKKGRNFTAVYHTKSYFCLLRQNKDQYLSILHLGSI
jgi:hypothetical protein